MLEVAPRDLGVPWYLRIDSPQPLVVVGQSPIETDAVQEAPNLSEAQALAGATGALLVTQVIRGKTALADLLGSLGEAGHTGRVLLAVDPGSGSSDAREDVLLPGELAEARQSVFSLENLQILDGLLILTLTGDRSGQFTSPDASKVVETQLHLLRQRDEDIRLARRRLALALRPDDPAWREDPPELATLLAEAVHLQEQAQSAIASQEQLQVLRAKFEQLRRRRVVRAANRAGRALRSIRSMGRRP